jgi:SMC interacting uncharacterized protein involved in chromosome segregation
MVNISRDGDGKTRIAKGDKTGLGGQYAPDPNKLVQAKNNLNELQDTLFDYDEKKVYQIWFHTHTYETGVLPYAPEFDNEIEAKQWVKNFYETEDGTDEVKSLEVVGIKVNKDGDFAGYIDPSEGETVEPEAEMQETENKNCSMTLQEMVDLVKEEWSDAMSDNGAIWSKTYAKLKEAKKECPALYEEAVTVARAETVESYKKAGLM